MKRAFLSLLAVAVCAFFAAGPEKFSTASHVSAQKSGRVSSDQMVRPSDGDLVEDISRVTNRSAAGLAEKFGPFGVFVDLEGRFQNVMLTRLEDDGSSAAACITSLGEANFFFGRNLETGERMERMVVDKTTSKIAADHGMSGDEFLFYQRLIEEYQQRLAMHPSAATINIVNNDGPGEGFNDPLAPFVANEGGNSGATRGAQRLNVFTTAAAIWGAFLDSNVQTNVGSNFDPLACSANSAVLGSAGTAVIGRDFPNAPFEGTWFHAALVNKITNVDGTPDADINARFNTSLDNGCFSGSSRFYYGLDGTSPAGTTNLLVVVLHELGHGLGFSSFTDGSTGAQFNGIPDIYSRFMYDRSTGLHWNEMSNAQRQASAVNNGNVFWDGPNVKMASSFLTTGRDADGRVALHTPVSFVGGSSVSHFSTSAFPNLLMEPNITAGLPITGDLTRQQLRDIGWFRDSNADATADAIVDVTPNGGTAVIGGARTITWTNAGGFSRNVSIELSTDGGASYPTVIASNVANNGSFVWTVPNISTSTARIRVREADFASPSGVSSANFTIGAAPVVTNVTVAGRVSDQSGRSLSKAIVVLTDAGGSARVAITNAFGYYYFENVPTGSGYTANVRHKVYSFGAQAVNLTGAVSDLNFVATN